MVRSEGFVEEKVEADLVVAERSRGTDTALMSVRNNSRLAGSKVYVADPAGQHRPTSVRCLESESCASIVVVRRMNRLYAKAHIVGGGMCWALSCRYGTQYIAATPTSNSVRLAA